MNASTRALRMLPLAALLALAPLAACHKEEPPPPAPAPAPTPAAAPAPAAPAAAPLTVVSLSIGKSVGADKKVPAEADTFAKGDTFYASVGTTGAATTANLTAKWSFVGKSGADKPVKEDTQAISPTGDAWTEFHASKPDGWPAGDYKVEILLDGKSVATKAFRVAK